MIIKFYTEGCTPCKTVSAILDELGVSYENVNIEKDMDSAIKYRVRTVPTLVNTETGKRLVGFKDKLTVEGWLDDNTD
jgi:thioredoxin 1|tara:strand:+ start:800 stop:1033 length:234 start_codon:yes stop_codon:yes gene_type:complete